ncbi:uncharacterized protein LOC143691731 isoform X2 [Tamandua tetradactyla]|uniref:uncharacterized protein LOC143691731 isoform X2 n=1 Tax=Tamandua tetradactyla TaxID=48850 RepID=UPI0040543F92
MSLFLPLSAPFHSQGRGLPGGYLPSFLPCLLLQEISIMDYVKNKTCNSKTCQTCTSKTCPYSCYLAYTLDATWWYPENLTAKHPSLPHHNFAMRKHAVLPTNPCPIPHWTKTTTFDSLPLSHFTWYHCYYPLPCNQNPSFSLYSPYAANESDLAGFGLPAFVDNYLCGKYACLDLRPLSGVKPLRLGTAYATPTCSRKNRQQLSGPIYNPLLISTINISAAVHLTPPFFFYLCPNITLLQNCILANFWNVSYPYAFIVLQPRLIWIPLNASTWVAPQLPYSFRTEGLSSFFRRKRDFRISAAIAAAVVASLAAATTAAVALTRTSTTAEVINNLTRTAAGALGNQEDLNLLMHHSIFNLQQQMDLIAQDIEALYDITSSMCDGWRRMDRVKKTQLCRWIFLAVFLLLFTFVLHLAILALAEEGQMTLTFPLLIQTNLGEVSARAIHSCF